MESVLGGVINFAGPKLDFFIGPVWDQVNTLGWMPYPIAFLGGRGRFVMGRYYPSPPPANLPLPPPAALQPGFKP